MAPPEHGIEPLGYIIAKEYLGKLSNYQLFKKKYDKQFVFET
jgi:hypothetical protein